MYAFAYGNVALLAPNRYNSGFRNIRPIPIRSPPVKRSIEHEFPITFSAFSSSWLPLAMEQRGAPPIPNKLANAVMIVIIGSARPIPVSAFADTPCKCPI